jgi:hypothetical protein
MQYGALMDDFVANYFGSRSSPIQPLIMSRIS